MGYAGRMFAQQNPWLYFGLWVVLLILSNISVISVIVQKRVSLLVSIPVVPAFFLCSLFILFSLFVSARQQNYSNKNRRYKNRNYYESENIIRIN